jgi:hypothetical protein
MRIRTAEPFTYLETRLKAGEQFFIDTLQDRGLFRSAKAVLKNAIPVVKGEKTRIAHDGVACVRIFPTNWTPEWGAARIRFEQYRFVVDCMIKTSVADIVDEYTMTFSLAVANWLLDFENLQPEIEEAGQKAFDSWIESCEFGYTKGQVWRVARIAYWLKLQHSYMTADLSTPHVC